ncbi:M81 family metallopeptidase [Pedobacter heparinus]|uniref:M81 family metallopeptidase n=1 Tax=Pedobacter heparinus TaxID=984 RepID=UPI002930C5F0|nr:M81 family metallopeptidase [Pedobacter heparinus]
MGLKVAVLGITHESNTFVKEHTTLCQFREGHWMKGETLLNEYRSAFHELGGMIEVLEEEGMEIVPVMYAEATPGGMVSKVTYETLLQELFTALDSALPVDGCLVVPHGAGVSELFRDMDGHWLSLVREKLGDRIPVIGTLDPHGNVSNQMVTSTNALVAYKTNPHIDQRETGRLAAKLLVNTLKKKIKPLQHLIQLPLAISIEQQFTGKAPCKNLYALADALSQQQGVLSISIMLGFPYADVEEMGSSVIVVTDDEEQLAISTGKMLEAYMMAHKQEFVGLKQDIQDLFPTIEKSEKPVLLLDMGDNVGGGAPANSAYLLKALEGYGRFRSFICLYDPAAVQLAISHTAGDIFDMVTGNPEDITMSYTGRVKLLYTGDGKFKETAPRHGGQVNFDMGKIALVVTSGGNTIMLTSLRVPPFSLKQLTAFNVIPEDFDVLVAKGVNAPIAAYTTVCKTLLQVNTPGVTCADMTRFNYNNRRKPIFPFEEI